MYFVLCVFYGDAALQQSFHAKGRQSPSSLCHVWTTLYVRITASSNWFRRNKAQSPSTHLFSLTCTQLGAEPSQDAWSSAPLTR
ncbi:hypothetical protein RRG08_039173 [Elysia crispata]|uniref:Uncharacterized protein n=1 Tax=Elysia crispata TaxID=231223 RepID=A0AAE1DEB8_9GAST|nr:hypothetical protein RRG08_039173 [Elysia crispata]